MVQSTTTPACPINAVATPDQPAVPEVKPPSKRETPVSSVPPTPGSERKMPPPSPIKRDLKTASATPSPFPSPLLSPAKLPAKPTAAAPYDHASTSTMSSVTPTPSTSTVQSNLTTPRSFCPDQVSL